MSKDRALLGLKRKDKETGLHYNRYRYYEPYSARYVSKDPIGLFGGLNNSAYVSDPNQWVDPMGLMAENKKYPDAKILRDKNIEFQEKEYDRLKSENAYTKINKVVDSSVSWMNNTAQKQSIQFRSRSIKDNERREKFKNPYGSDPRRKGCECKIYDYLACSGSLGGQSITIVKNLWADENKGWYLAGSKGALITQTSPKSPKDLLGFNCAAGIIHFLEEKNVKKYGMERITHEFVNGASSSAGAVFGPGVGVGFNYVDAMTTEKSMVHGAKSVEFVIGTVGYNIDIGVTGKMSRE